MKAKVAVLLLVGMGLLLGGLQPSGTVAQDQDQPALQVSPTSLSFEGRVGGPTPAPQYLTLVNAGGGIMEWHAFKDADWIILGATEGKLSGGRVIQLLVWVNTEGLEAGIYRGTITISAPGAQGSPVYVTVLLRLFSEGAFLNANILSLIGVDSYYSRGITGQGVKISVIDLGFAGLNEVITKGELPEDIVAWNCLGRQTAEQPSPCRRVSPAELSQASGMEVHGTAVAEIIHDVAPDAELHLFLVGTEFELDQAEAKAIDEGVKVINHSIGWWSYRYDFDHFDCSETEGHIIQDVRRNGIFWAQAAGSQAQGHYEALFRDQDGDHYHDENITLQLGPDSHISISFIWEAGSGTEDDFDLFLERGARVVASSHRPSRELPEEVISFTTEEGGTYRLQIKWTGEGTPTEQRMEMTFIKGTVEMYPTTLESSLKNPAGCAEAFVVGAINPRTLEIEPFSSRGPSNAGLTKPDLVAPDCLHTASYEQAPTTEICGADGLLAGTSASASLVAGAAALLLAEDPSRSVDDLARILKERAIPKGDPNTYGAGLLSLRERGTGP